MDLTRIITLILLSVLPIMSQAGLYFRCPLHPCLCESGDLGIVMNCRQRFLTRIPPIIPSDLVFQELSLKKNNIRHLAANAFRGIKVKRIDLSENIVSKIDDNAFVGVEDILEELVLQVYNLEGLPLNALRKLRVLRVLHVISCKVPVLMNSTFETLSTLEEIRLISCGIQSVEPHAFLGLEKTLRVLDFFGNDLQTIPSDALGRLDRTEKLVFTGNKLKEIDKRAFWGLKQLLHLELSSNSIYHLHPRAFDGVHTSLEFLGLQRNHLISKDLLSLKILHNLHQVELAYNKIENIPRHLFRRLNMVTLIGLQANKIQGINRQTFMGTERELKVLLLSANEVNTIAPNTFQGFRKLRHLYLDRTNAGNGLSRHSFKGIGGSLETLNMQRSGFTATGFVAIMDLSELKTLVLRDNKITSLPIQVFNKLHRLTRLDLQGNRLKALTKPQTFQGLQKSLRQLVLSNNMIQSLSECVFQGFKQLRDIVLNQNPLQCDCQMSWLKQWVISKTSRFSRNILNWVCTGPAIHAGKLFRDVRDEEMTCPEGYLRRTCDNHTHPTLLTETSSTADSVTSNTDSSSIFMRSSQSPPGSNNLNADETASDKPKMEGNSLKQKIHQENVINSLETIINGSGEQSLISDVTKTAANPTTRVTFKFNPGSPSVKGISKDMVTEKSRRKTLTDRDTREDHTAVSMNSNMHENPSISPTLASDGITDSSVQHELGTSKEAQINTFSFTAPSLESENSSLRTTSIAHSGMPTGNTTDLHRIINSSLTSTGNPVSKETIKSHEEIFPSALLTKLNDASTETMKENVIPEDLFGENKENERVKTLNNVKIDRLLNLTSAAASGRIKSSSSSDRIESDMDRNDNTVSISKSGVEPTKDRSLLLHVERENTTNSRTNKTPDFTSKNTSVSATVTESKHSEDATSVVLAENKTGKYVELTTKPAEPGLIIKTGVPKQMVNTLLTGNPSVTNLTSATSGSPPTAESSSKGSAKMHNTTHAGNINVTYRGRLEGDKEDIVTEALFSPTIQHNTNDNDNLFTSPPSLNGTQTTESAYPPISAVLSEVYFPTTSEITTTDLNLPGPSTAESNDLNSSDKHSKLSSEPTNTVPSKTTEKPQAIPDGQIPTSDNVAAMPKTQTSSIESNFISIPAGQSTRGTSDRLLNHTAKSLDSGKYTKSLRSTRFPSPTPAHDPTSVVKPSTSTSIDPNDDDGNSLSHVPSPTRQLPPSKLDKSSNKRYRYQDLYSDFALKNATWAGGKVVGTKDTDNYPFTSTSDHLQGDTLLNREIQKSTEEKIVENSKGSSSTSWSPTRHVIPPTTKWKSWIPVSWSSTKRVSTSAYTKPPFDGRTFYGKHNPIFVRTVPPIVGKVGVKRVFKNPYSKEDIQSKYLYTGSPRSIVDSMSVIKNWLNSAWGVQENRNHVNRWVRPTSKHKPRIYKEKRVRNPYEKFKNFTTISAKVILSKPPDERQNPPNVQGSIEFKTHGGWPKSRNNTDKEETDYPDVDIQKDAERTRELLDKISGPRSRDGNIITNTGSGIMGKKKQKGGSIFQVIDLAPKHKESNNVDQSDQQKNKTEIDRINSSQLHEALLVQNTSVDITESGNTMGKDVSEKPSDTQVVTERPAPTKSLSTQASEVSFNNGSSSNSSTDMKNEDADPQQITPTESKIDRFAVNKFELFINAVPYASNAVKVTWNVSHGFAVTGFRVSHGNVLNMSMMEGPLLDGTVRTYDLTSLVPEEEYKFCVTAYLSATDIRQKSKCKEIKIEFEEIFPTVSTREKTKTLALIIGSYGAGALVLVTLLLSVALLVRRYRDKSKTGLYVPRASPYWIDFLCGGLATSRFSTTVLDSSTATVSSGVEMSENDCHSDSDESGTYSFEYSLRSLPAQHIWSTADLHTNLYTYQ